MNTFDCDSSQSKQNNQIGTEIVNFLEGKTMFKSIGQPNADLTSVKGVSLTWNTIEHSHAYKLISAWHVHKWYNGSKRLARLR